MDRDGAGPPVDAARRRETPCWRTGRRVPHPVDAGFDALQSRGHYPINHTVVVKDELLRAYPDLGKELFDAFVAAKRPYVEQLKNGELALSTKTDQTYKRVLEITGADPLPYGVEPNRRMIEAVIGYARQQGILSRSFPMAELFAPGTLDLVG